MTKKELRNTIRQKKKGMTSKEIREKSEKIFKQLEKMKQWKNADCIFSYVSYNQEVYTRGRMAEWLAQEKKIAVPCVIKEKIKFYSIDSMADLKEGYKGILEPERKKCADGESGIMLMPGLAFDELGHRLGYGGGYYDRYLKRYQSNFLKVALAYDFQIVEEIPCEIHDQMVDWIITENRVIEIEQHK